MFKKEKLAYPAILAAFAFGSLGAVALTSPKDGNAAERPASKNHRYDGNNYSGREDAPAVPPPSLAQ
ncbi:MAG: hypothetical protein DI551_10550 [Micavibrio aeruginosavorus]|uniref:Uncharacterized protein n=1 Tax=Micavibrio aeruginosavorus TaxID=349221 RepID=A0A2W5MTV3_9BACT|nr:MAG: hypothetical protein DI551_10550 [Micavibrio aeruginosavorus]